MTATAPSLLMETGPYQDMVKAVAERLDDLEATIGTLDEDASNTESSQQRSIVLFYTRQMRAQIALTRLETSQPAIDLEVLYRTLGNMCETTRDFIATIRGMPNKISARLTGKADSLAESVIRLIAATRAVVDKMKADKAIPLINFVSDEPRNSLVAGTAEPD